MKTLEFLVMGCGVEAIVELMQACQVHKFYTTDASDGKVSLVLEENA